MGKLESKTEQEEVDVFRYFKQMAAAPAHPSDDEMVWRKAVRADLRMLREGHRRVVNVILASLVLGLVNFTTICYILMKGG